MLPPTKKSLLAKQTFYLLRRSQLDNSFYIHAASELRANFTPISLYPNHPFLTPSFIPLFSAESVETVNEVEPPAPTITTTTTTAATTRRKLGAEELLSTVELFLSESLVSQVGASYQFNILLPSGARSTYFIDLSTGHYYWFSPCLSVCWVGNVCPF